MILALECLYCGHKWEKNAYNAISLESERCPRCKDSNLKVKELSKSKVDYYVGCPPFPKKEEDSGWPWGMGGFIDPGSVD
jgi:hypothetical protein